MENARYHVFGIVNEYLRYIGWTERPLSDEEEIFLDLINRGGGEIPGWLERDARDHDIEVFEIESMATSAEAKHSVEFWGQYYCMVGAKVITDAS